MCQRVFRGAFGFVRFFAAREALAWEPAFLADFAVPCVDPKI
jgi:hypothetical protein